MIVNTFIQELNKRRSEYAHPDQATTQEHSLIQLSSGIYTEEERFVFELLQNAVDAYNSTGGCLYVQMIIKDGYLIFLHNGDAFSERDIEGLCDVGNGNKMKDSKKIGYKGIGFKSVFMRSTCVTVESSGYCFKFDKDAWTGYWDKQCNWKTSYGERNPDKMYLMPWQIIPIETTVPILVDKQNSNVATYIRIENEQSLAVKIKKLMVSSQFMLFLKCKNIRMTFTMNGEIESSIEKTTDGNLIILSSNGHEESRWLIHINEEVQVPDDLRASIQQDVITPLKLKEAKTFDLSFAIALDKNGKLKKLDDAVVYTYLPTSFKFGTIGFPFLVNANFITDAGRQQLHKDSEWNKLIFSKIPSEFLGWIKSLSGIYSNYYEVLPEKEYGSANALEEIYTDEMKKAIDSIAFIPSLIDAENKLLVSQAVMDRMGISEAISKLGLARHINRIYNKLFLEESFVCNVWNGSRILSTYGVFLFDKKKLKNLFDDTEAFKGISTELDKKLIEFLYTYYIQNPSEQDDLLEELKQTKFLLDEDGVLSWANNLFFPSNYKEQNDMAEDAKILHPDIKTLISSNRAVYDWLKKLGVEEMSDITFIKNVICKSGYLTKDNAIEVIRFLFDVNKRINIFDEIGDYYLRNLKFLSKCGSLSDATNLYLGSLYKPETNIENVYDGDIFVSEQYVQHNDAVEWGIFFKKLGVNNSLELTTVQLKETKNYSILIDLKEKFNENYNVGSWGNKFFYSFRYFNIHYAPFIITSSCSIEFQKLIWSSILTKELENKSDCVYGSAGKWDALRRFSDLGHSNFIRWAIQNIQKFPAKNGQCLFATELLQNTEDIVLIADKYLPVLDIDGEIHESWISLLGLRNVLHLDDYLTILSNISKDTDNVENNHERISKIYQRIVELDYLSSESKKQELRRWAQYNTILSRDKEFVSPSELSHITLDGFASKNRLFIGKLSSNEKVVELMRLWGVKIITAESIEPQYDNSRETCEIKDCLTAKISALALLKAGEEPTKEEYEKSKRAISLQVAETHFYHCDKISLSYGNVEDMIDKATFGLENKFYYTGNLRPANLEPLMSPLCSFFKLRKKCESELFILMIEDMEGLRSYLKEKGYNIDFLKDDSIVNTGKVIETQLHYSPSEVQERRNVITGLKGEIIMYEYLLRQGYQPICPSISDESDYDYIVHYNDKTYYCNNNFNKYDITYTSENGIKVYMEVKATVCDKKLQENMPISYRELSMVEQCNDSPEEAYIIARVFNVDSSSPDVYFFKGHTIELYN